MTEKQRQSAIGHDSAVDFGGHINVCFFQNPCVKLKRTLMCVII